MSETAIATANAQILFDKKFSEGEIEILRGVLDRDARVDLIIPDKIDPQRLWDSFEVCCHVVERLKEAGDKVKPLIGRMLVVLKDYPEIIRAKGYETYEEFMAKGMQELFRISRSEAYACRLIAEKFPSLTIEEYKQIGIAKMQVLSRGTGEDQKDCREFLDYAKDHTVADVKARVAKKLNAAEGELDYCQISIDANVDIARAWRDFVQDPRVRAYCETEQPGKILALAIAEASASWIPQGEYLVQGGR